MGINDEYSRDAYAFDLAFDSDESDEYDREMDPLDWQDMYSNELLDGWMCIREHAEDNYMKLVGTYPDFVDLVLDASRWYTGVHMNIDQQVMWSRIANLPIISERVKSENFCAWANNFVTYF